MFYFVLMYVVVNILSFSTTYSPTPSTHGDTVCSKHIQCYLERRVGTWRSSSGRSGTSSSVGQYHLSTCMDFPVSHLWGWWIFSRFLFELLLLYSKMVLSYGRFLPDVVCIYFNDNQYICE